MPRPHGCRDTDWLMSRNKSRVTTDCMLLGCLPPSIAQQMFNMSRHLGVSGMPWHLTSALLVHGEDVLGIRYRARSSAECRFQAAKGCALHTCDASQVARSTFRAIPDGMQHNLPPTMLCKNLKIQVCKNLKIQVCKTAEIHVTHVRFAKM